MIKMEILIALVIGLFTLVAATEVDMLGSFNASIHELTLSGHSSGAYMVVQMHFAFSSYIQGVSSIGGGPYYCSMGQFSNKLNCQTRPAAINVEYLLDFTKKLEQEGLIDPLENIKNKNVFVFEAYFSKESATSMKLETMYKSLEANVTASYDSNIGHIFIKNLPKEILNVPFNESLSQSGNETLENLHKFNQSEFATENSTLSEIGYIYIPTACKYKEKCKLHISFHGCKQGVIENIPEHIYNADLNRIAEGNNIIILYPQLNFSEKYPYGCWDYWGYTDGNDFNTKYYKYATKKGVQMDAVWSMIKRITNYSTIKEIDKLIGQKVDNIVNETTNTSHPLPGKTEKVPIPSETLATNDSSTHSSGEITPAPQDSAANSDKSTEGGKEEKKIEL